MNDGSKVKATKKEKELREQVRGMKEREARKYLQEMRKELNKLEDALDQHLLDENVAIKSNN